MIPDRSVTERGFVIYDKFPAGHNSEIRVQESSSALDECVWIFCFADDGMIATPHLNVRQAIRLRGALDVFISEHGGMSDET